jgi:glutathione S-transferase
LEVEMARIILHQWEISPFCGKVRKLLRKKNLDFTVVNYNGLLAARASRLSPAKKLPVIEYDGQFIQDSTDIAEFLEAKLPQPSFYPAEERERAKALLWEDWADESLYWFEVYFRFMYPEALEKSTEMLCEGRPKFEQRILKLVATRIYKKKLDAQGLGRLDQKRVEGKFFVHLQMLETILGMQRWLVGSAQSIADVGVSAQLDEMIRTSHLKGKILGYPHLKSWLESN